MSRHCDVINAVAGTRCYMPVKWVCINKATDKVEYLCEEHGQFTMDDPKYLTIKSILETVGV